MRIGKWSTLLLLASTPVLAGFLTGCGDFWQAPGGSTTASFTLSNSGNISVAAGATAGNTSTITVTPASTFTGSVSLACAVTTSLSSPTSPVTCSLSPTSLTFSSATAQTAALTAATTATTTTGAYTVTVTGLSGSVSETTSVCVTVGSTTASCSGSGSGTSGNFYVLNQTTQQIAALSIVSGQLNTIGDTAVPAGPLAMAIAPNGKFLYVGTLNGIYLYTIGSSGALTLGNNSQTLSPDIATTMQVDATNGWLVDGISGVKQLYAIAINPSTGELATSGESEQFVTLPASTITQLAISPNDSSSCNSCYVFAGMGTGGTEIVLFNPGNANPFGNAGTIKLINTAGGDNAVAVDPTNRLLYVGESDALSTTQSGGLRVFTIASGGVTELTSAGSPYSSGGTGPVAILPTSDGSYVYIANQAVSGSANGNIAGFSVSSTSLTSTSTVATGPSGLLGLAEDPTHSFVLAVDFAGDPDLQAYGLSSGTLTSTLTVATGTDPVGAIAIVAAP